MNKKNKEWISTPLGWLRVVGNEERIARIDILPKGDGPVERVQQSRWLFLNEWVKNYFLGIPEPFPWEWLDLGMASSFQKKVWRALWEIPFGVTRSYGMIATLIGNSRACRAVGQANHQNPCPLVIPCHRVIAADGSLGGFACGVEIKKKLLKHEKIKWK